jgi:hypothetical protein
MDGGTSKPSASQRSAVSYAISIKTSRDQPVGPLCVSLAPNSAAPAEILEDQIDVNVVRHGGGDRWGGTRDATPHDRNKYKAATPSNCKLKYGTLAPLFAMQRHVLA